MFLGWIDEDFTAEAHTQYYLNTACNFIFLGRTTRLLTILLTQFFLWQATLEGAAAPNHWQRWLMMTNMETPFNSLPPTWTRCSEIWVHKLEYQRRFYLHNNHAVPFSWCQWALKRSGSCSHIASYHRVAAEPLTSNFKWAKMICTRDLGRLVYLLNWKKGRHGKL
jgi:hypothetical protein